MILAAKELPAIASQLAALAEPWNKLLSHSKPVSAAVLFLHIAPLIIGGGVAFSADLATLRAHRAGPAERESQLVALSATHRLVLFGLGLSVVSGIGLFLSDVENFWSSIFWWIKILMVILLLINGFILTRTESALLRNKNDTAAWSRLRIVAVLSVVLWLGTALAGVVLKEFA